MRTASVSKCLDKKLVMFGFEVFDILTIFLTLSILNFIFGQSSLKLLFVWLPTILVGVVLRYGKRGKPDKYLVHWLRYQVKPGIYSAFPEPTIVLPPPQLHGRAI
jgi:hypothetical protein